MDKTLQFFLIGFAVGLVIALVPMPQAVDSDKLSIISGGLVIWKVVYFTILVVMLPFLVVEPLKKRLKVKQLFPLQFIVGNSCAMGIVTLIFTVSTLI